MQEDYTVEDGRGYKLQEVYEDMQNWPLDLLVISLRFAEKLLAADHQAAICDNCLHIFNEARMPYSLVAAHKRTKEVIIRKYCLMCAEDLGERAAKQLALQQMMASLSLNDENSILEGIPRGEEGYTPGGYM